MKYILAILLTASFLWGKQIQAQDKDAQLESFSTFFSADKKWLVLPVKNGAPKRNIELWVDGKDERFFDIELADNQPADWYAYLDISGWKNKSLELRVDKLTKASSTFSPPLQSDEDSNAAPLYKEKLRGQFHFSPKRGWTNDPNGMVYYNGEYHLFFQHNPYGREWGNMSWGHAVSKDLIHWTELGTALHPDRFGPMFSGSAVVDAKNTSGFGKDGKAPMVMFYTCARSWGQGLAWSTDGRNFDKLDHMVVSRINKDNRDPKVIWHEPTKQWVMVLYVERDKGQHSMQFLTSPNLKDWTRTSTIMGGVGDDRYLFECPEFFELPVDGNAGEKKWILTAANSQYAIGSFDGKTFTPEVERLNGQLGRDFYASQTFNDEPKGRRIEIGWWRTYTNKEDMSFNQSQSIPLELKLVRTSEGLRLTRMPVKELESLRAKKHTKGKFNLKEDGANPIAGIKAELLEIRTSFAPEKATEVSFTIRGVPVVYNAVKQELTIDKVTAPAKPQNGKIGLIIYADRTGLEVFINDGLVFMPVNINLKEGDMNLSVSAKGGAAKFLNLDVYELKSIW